MRLTGTENGPGLAARNFSSTTISPPWTLKREAGRFMPRRRFTRARSEVRPATPQHHLVASRTARPGPQYRLSRLADAVGMRTRAGQLAAIHDQILLANRAILKPAFKDLPGPSGVAGLSRQ